MAYFLYVRDSKKFISEKSKKSIKMNSTAVWDNNVWDTFFNNFNN